MKNYFFILLAIILLVGCSSIDRKEYSNNMGQKIIEEWYNDSQIKSRTTFLSSDSTEYVYSLWYESGEIEDSARYLNQNVDGIRIYYDQSADLKHFETYDNGIFCGAHKAVYGNGAISFEGFHKNGKKVGEWHFNYPNNNPITYEFYDSAGKVLYFRKYDEKQLVTESKGNAIIDVNVLENNEDSDAVLLNVLCANPPGSSVKIEITGKTGDVFFNQSLEKINNTFEINIPETGMIELNIRITFNDAGNIENHAKSFEFMKP